MLTWKKVNRIAIGHSSFILGLLHLLTGAVKTKSFGRAFAPDLYHEMTVYFSVAHDVLPLYEIISPMRMQEIFATLEMLCGFMLISRQLIPLAGMVLSLVLLCHCYLLNLLDQFYWHNLTLSFGAFILAMFVRQEPYWYEG
uniref:uncharacterized protein LOC120338458 n=1 Tax=Styela clava TaxID=7725 RepID=UPI0019397AA3|nr:uncharacterized protein LOC120338458 [Styela clava]